MGIKSTFIKIVFFYGPVCVCVIPSKVGEISTLVKDKRGMIVLFELRVRSKTTLSNTEFLKGKAVIHEQISCTIAPTKKQQT